MQPRARGAGCRNSFGFVSFLGVEFGLACNLHLPGQWDVFVSDFANDIRRYNCNGVLEAQLSTHYTGTSLSNNFVDGLTFAPWPALHRRVQQRRSGDARRYSPL